MTTAPSLRDIFQLPTGVYSEPTGKRIRAMLGGRVVVDTTSAVLVWEHPFYPQYYLPLADVAPGALIATGTTSDHDRLGPAVHYTVRSDRGDAVDAAWVHGEAPDDALRSLVRFDWAALDAWFEEDVEVFVHPRSPYTRIDVLDSSREIRVDINGVTVASSVRSRILFETGLSPRYYLPKTDVRFELLTPTDLTTACPYKGTARYWSVEIDGSGHQNVVWGYDSPLAESLGVAGLVCFYTEQVELFVDGQKQG